MSVLPIVDRELRVAARRRSAFWVRVLAATGAVAIGGAQLWVESDWRAAAGMGREIFETLSRLAFGFSLVAGPVLTADVLSEEKREGTLGLLFLTDLRALDIVLGKLVAASVTALFALLAVLPVLALSLLLGGVSFAEFGRMTLALGNTLWFSLTAGMAMSALCVQGRSAFALAGLAIFLTAGVPWLYRGLSTGAATGLTPVLGALGPTAAVFGASATATGGDAAAYWRALGGAHALGWGFLVAAAWLTGRAWRELTALRLSARWEARWFELLLGKRSERRALRERLLDRNPMLWLGSRLRLKRTLLWGVFSVLLVAWLLARLVAGPQWWSPGMILLVATFFQFPLKWLVASEAAYRFAEDRRSGALELLLTTGLGERDLVRGQMLAIRRLFEVPVALVLAVETVLLLGAGSSATYEAEWGLAAVVMFLTVWDLHALAWTGMWYSVAGRRPQYASLRALYRVLGVPWMCFLGILFIIGVWNWTLVIGLWVGICALSNRLAYTTARRGLAAHFRSAAAGLYGGRTTDGEGSRAGAGVVPHGEAPDPPGGREGQGRQPQQPQHPGG
jgi:hypothetical protein